MRHLGWAALALLLVPPLWAVWVSFSPGELLRPPVERWSLRWHVTFFTDARWTAALFNSVVVAAGASLVAVLAGVPAALTRSARLGRLVLLPLCVPPVVLGMGLLPTMHALGLYGTYLSLVLAHGLLGMPLVFLTTRAAHDAMPADVEEAARGLGASPWTVFRRVTLPLCGHGIAAGAVLAFVLSLNEFFLALFLASPDTETLPAVIWPRLRYTLSPLVAAASVYALAVTAAGLVPLARLWGGGNFQP
jgi:ABC-type spermidine/putrescine transport system permease subunit II